MTLDLPLVFALLMGAAILAYVVLDGYDLGVGMLMPGASAAEQDVMVASIGPFWDANETWLDPRRALPAGGRHAHRADAARRGLRVPRQGRGLASRTVELAVLVRLF